MIFYLLSYLLVLIPIALLICTENTFWDISGDETQNFVELFKTSFTSYVESGIREMVEREIDILRNEQGGFSVTEDFKAKFYKFIVDHYLRKFQFFLSALNTSNHWHCLCLNTAQPGESRAHHDAIVEYAGASGDEMLELQQKNQKKNTWLQKLKLKFWEI
jgi:hypothetical protein